MINIILIDDHTIFGEAISNLLPQNSAFNFVGFFPTTEGLEPLFEENTIDLVLLDISVSPTNGIDYCKQLKANFPAVKVLFFSMHSDELIINRAIRAGGNGYITKRNSIEVLFEGIEKVMAGEEYFSPDIENIRQKRYLHIETKNIPDLSKRESEVLNLIVRGNTNQEIALKLGLSNKTVSFHRSNLLIKFDAKNGVELAREAIKAGLIKIY